MSYSKVKQKKQKLSTGVKSSSPHIVKSSSPHLYQDLYKKRRAKCARAHAREIGNHNPTVCSKWDTTAGDHPTTSHSFRGVVQVREKSTHAGGCPLFSVKCFSKKAQRFFKNHGYHYMPLVYPVFDNVFHDIHYMPDLKPLPKLCCMGKLEDWNMNIYYRR